MAKKENQKLKLLYLVKILSEKSDDRHGLTTCELENLLGEYGISVERKTLYSDIALLSGFGYDIVKEKIGKNMYYHMGNREFELPELKLLVDLVQSSKFITNKKSNALIHKLEKLSSMYDAKSLQRQVYVAGRIKSENENIYYAVDKLHEAINSDVIIEFKYYQWNMKKEKEARHNGKIYKVSPWALTWSDGNYYLIAFDEEQQEIRHYRVDKMQKVSLTNKKRNGKKAFESVDMALYTKRRFGMFSGDETEVSLQADNDMVGILIDYLGRDIPITCIDEYTFETKAKVVPSEQFICWVLSLGNKIKITAPEELVSDVRRLLKERVGLYEDYKNENEKSPFGL